MVSASFENPLRSVLILVPVPARARFLDIWETEAPFSLGFSERSPYIRSQKLFSGRRPLFMTREISFRVWGCDAPKESNATNAGHNEILNKLYTLLLLLLRTGSDC